MRAGYPVGRPQGEDRRAGEHHAQRLPGWKSRSWSSSKTNHLPLDFYSFHFYANKSVNPLDNARLGEYFRELLDSYGFKQAEVINTEYGGSLDGTVMIGGPVAPAYLLSP